MTPMRNLARILPVAALFLAPTLAHADVIDCYPPVVSIVAPEDGASLEGVSEIPVTVSVEAAGADAELSRVWVLVDDVEAASLDITASGSHELMVPVSEGSHELVAGATDDCGGDETSDPITIEVTGGGRGGSKDDSGCAVARTPTRSWVGLSAFLLVVLGAWRLRRSDS